MSSSVTNQTSNQKLASVSCPYTICVATSRSPSTAVAAVHPILSVDPQTGASSCLCKAGVGIRSLAKTSCYDNNNNVFLLAYGGASSTTTNSHQDNYCMLLSISPNDNVGGGGGGIKWKCRLPEYVSSGIATSPCGQYVVAGGGASGNCYIWSILQKGLLVSVWKCHYGPVTCVIFSDCGQYVITGGADGIVQVYSLSDLVATTGQPQPMYKWSEHDLQVTHLCVLPNSHGRFVSSSNDQRLVIMELFGGLTLARIQLPSAIHCITTDSWSHVLYAGAVNGTIYCVDLDAHAIAATVEARAVMVVNTIGRKSVTNVSKTNTTTAADTPKNTNETAAPTDTSTDIVSELHGHVHPISCIAFLPSTSSLLDIDDTARLISGDEHGCVRIWSIKSRVCTLVLHPWTFRGTSTISDTTMETTSATNPCSAILVIPNKDSTIASSRWNATAANSSNVNSKKNELCTSSFLYPLRRFTAAQQQSDLSNEDIAVDGINNITTTIQPLRRKASTDFWDGGNMLERVLKRSRMKQWLARQYHHKGLTNPDDESERPVSPKEVDYNDEVLQLKQKLAEAEETITRWQTVNNKLLSKLNRQPKS